MLNIVLSAEHGSVKVDFRLIIINHCNRLQILIFIVLVEVAFDEFVGIGQAVSGVLWMDCLLRIDLLHLLVLTLLQFVEPLLFLVQAQFFLLVEWFA